MADETTTTPAVPAPAVPADDAQGELPAPAANTTTLPNIAASLASLEAGTGSGAATPRSTLSDLPPMTAEQRSLSLKVSLADLTARASHHHAQRNYDEAAEVYAQAAEMQAEMNGEMSPENAEILFLYGRSLFKVGQGKSDVLGGKAPAAAEGSAGRVGKGKGKGKGNKGGARKKTANGAKEGGKAVAGSSKEAGGTPEADKVAQEAVKIIADQADGVKTEKDELEAKKPLFQFTGDENWDDSDEEGAGEGEGDSDAEEEDEEEEDDLATAFEILDLARVLLSKKLEEKLAADTSEGKGKDAEAANGERDDVGIKHIKERLADAHDLLAEISLENERYPNAIVDARESLKYKQQLLPEDSEIIAEAHYKLSLALEFASVTSQSDDDAAAGAPKEVNQELRDEAAGELEAAIASTKLKLQNKEVELATLHSPEDNEITRSQIAETKEIIADMESRLVELRGPPIDVQAALGGDPMGGIVGAALGESTVQTEARIEEAKKTAVDLTGLVRKKGKPAASPAPAAADEPSQSNATKRKAEDDIDMEDDVSKKPRTEEEEQATV